MAAASPPATAANATGGGYVVQLSSQRSEADAQASFRSLQEKFPTVLRGRTAVVRRTDLGAKGIYYRVVMGPFAAAGEADQFCSSLKAAGGQCIIQRN
jgi:cell division septation protein DedD